MYFNSVSDTTLKTFTNKVNVNKSYTLEEISVSDYWSIEDLNGVLKCIPLFHTEEISSSNSNDSVISTNKGIICEYNTDTVIYCKGSTNPIVDNTSFVLYAYTLDLNNIYCIVTDKYNNLLKNKKITVYKENTNKGTVNTNTNGICKYTSAEEGSYYFEFETYQSNTVVIE